MTTEERFENIEKSLLEIRDIQSVTAKLQQASERERKEQIGELREVVVHIANAQQRTDAAIQHLAEQQTLTDAALKSLITSIDRFIQGRGGNGQRE